MFSPMYYLCVGLVITLLQKTPKRAILSGIFFTALLSLPLIRNYIGADFDVFYLSWGVIWIALVLALEDSRERVYILMCACLFGEYVTRVFLFGAVEITVIALLYDSKLSYKYLWRKDTK